MDTATKLERYDLSENNIKESKKERWSVPAILRFGGALILLTSATTFLFQNWDLWTDIQRYYGFLIYTVVLTATGFFCGVKLHEGKSARTLLAVVGAIIPVHFSQLGALLYSCLGAPLASYPEWLTWKAPATGTALFTVALGIAVLIPTALTVFTALARPHARLLTAGLISGSAFLLLPIRDPVFICIIGMVMLIGGMVLDRRLAVNTACRTGEGVMARAMLGLPLLILLGRSLHLYEFSFMVLSLALMTVAVFFFYLLPVSSQDDRTAAVYQYIGSIPACLSAMMLGLEVVSRYSPSDQYLVMLLHLPVALTLFGLSFVTRGDKNLYRFGAAFSAVSCTLMQVTFVGGLGTATAGLIIGLVCGAYAYEKCYYTLCGAAVVLFLASIGSTLRYALEVFPLQPWMILGGIGIAAVVGAAYLERSSSFTAEQNEE